MHKDGGPAFATDLEYSTGCDEGNVMRKYMGLSVRDWFAGMALQGMITNDEIHKGFIDPVSPEDSLGTKLLCADAYRIANAMLKAREEQEN